ncbi:hypothetical protein [Aeromicrobium sp. A1-2]|uniref:hypothetical protein n=1 Tax=Aeromicrobium sp. A1-2 TaxID=2107713 RepID=UPI0013C30D4D|nr:hypothetical protein [Aeromicrobium sp. A1-2]
MERPPESIGRRDDPMSGVMLDDVEQVAVGRTDEEARDVPLLGGQGCTISKPRSRASAYAASMSSTLTESTGFSGAEASRS